MPCMILPWIENGDIRRYMKNHVSDTKQKAGWVGFPLAFTSQDSAMLMIYIWERGHKRPMVWNTCTSMISYMAISGG